MEFKPSGGRGAREAIRRNDFGLYDDEFDLKKKEEYYEAQHKKSKQKYGTWHHSFYFDAGSLVDEFGMKKS